MTTYISYAALAASAVALAVSFSGVGYSPIAENYIALQGDLTMYADTVIDLTNTVEELRIEVAHIHEFNIELGDNLDARIDELGSTLGTVSADIAQSAIDAKAYTDSKASELYITIQTYMEGFKWPEIPEITWPDITLPSMPWSDK